MVADLGLQNESTIRNVSNTSKTRPLLKQLLDRAEANAAVTVSMVWSDDLVGFSVGFRLPTWPYKREFMYPFSIFGQAITRYISLVEIISVYLIMISKRLSNFQNGILPSNQERSYSRQNFPHVWVKSRNPKKSYMVGFAHLQLP